MEIVEFFKIMILTIDLKNVNLGPAPNYDGLRQQIGLTIDTSLSGPRAGQWIGGRTKNKKIYLFFRVSDPVKAKKFILRSLGNQDILSKAKIRITEKHIKWNNYALL